MLILQPVFFISGRFSKVENLCTGWLLELLLLVIRCQSRLRIRLLKLETNCRLPRGFTRDVVWQPHQAARDRTRHMLCQRNRSLMALLRLWSRTPGLWLTANTRLTKFLRFVASTGQSLCTMCIGLALWSQRSLQPLRSRRRPGTDSSVAAMAPSWLHLLAPLVWI